MSRRTGLTFAALGLGLLCSSAASANETIKYTYDARGRLIKAERTPASTVNTNVQACYKYDKADNRDRVKTTTALVGGVLPPCP